METLADHLRSAMTALRRHIYLEEEFAFPPIREGGLTMPIMVMEREHAKLWEQMDALEASLDGLTEADDAQRSALVQACTDMLALLESHNSKEEPIVYPHLDVKLSPAQTKELRNLIETGTTPVGWVCVMAR